MKKSPSSAVIILTMTALACDHAGLHVHASLKDGIYVAAKAPTPTKSDQVAITTTQGDLALAPLTTYSNCDEMKTDLRSIVTVAMKYSWDQAQYYRSQAASGYTNQDAAGDASSVLTSGTSFGASTYGATAVGALASAASASAPAASASAPAASASATTTTDPSASSNVGTNVQVTGVDEADDIKITSTGIYVADNQNPNAVQTVHVYAASPLSYLTDLVIDDLLGAKLYTDANWLIAVGTATGSMPTTSGVIPLNSQAIPISAFYSSYSQPQGTGVRVYDVTSPQTPKLAQSYTSKSQLVDSRVIGGRLYMVLRDTLTQNQVSPNPSEQDLNGDWHTFASTLNVDTMFNFTSDSVDGLKCSSVIKLPSYMSAFQYQRIVALDIASGKVLSEVTVPGNGDTLYMTSSNLYTVGQPEQAPIWDAPTYASGAAIAVAGTTSSAVAGGILIPQGYTSPTGVDQLVVTKVSIDVTGGMLKPVARGEIPGHLKLFDSQWAFNEMPSGSVQAGPADQVLAVVTSTGDLYNPTTNPPQNHLLVLQQQGNQLTIGGRVDGFGKNENVRAVRYLGNYAYVVTFERTDPLYTIDLSSPLAPEVKGELDIPGFSMYLQPHGTGRLIGTGFMTEDSGDPDITRAFFQGLLVQFFDITNPAASKQLWTTTLGKRGSYSEANQDAHAFYYDAVNNMMAIPTVLFDNSATAAAGVANVNNVAPSNGLPYTGVNVNAPNGQTTNTTLLFSGAVFYSILDQSLQEAVRITHYDLLDANCKADLLPLFWTTRVAGAPDIRRIYRLGDTIYTVSNFGVKTLDVKSLTIGATAKIATGTCPVQQKIEGFE